MINQGYIKPISPGVFSLMQLAIRSLEKMYHLIDNIMMSIHAQKVLFPTLIQDTLLKTSGMLKFILNYLNIYILIT